MENTVAYVSAHCSQTIIRGDMMGGEMRNATKFLVGKPERKRSLERHKCRWEDMV
jgi:hypothetical protein